MEQNVLPRELKHAFLERLMHYYHFVASQLTTADAETVTSKQIAELVHMDDTLVRKDLAAIGVRGLPRVGFKTVDVLMAIREVLGFDVTYRGIVVGVGRLGSAMASYRGFVRYGLVVCGLFDSDPVKVGLLAGEHVILPMERLPEVVAEQDVGLAVLTVPAPVAQEAADFVVDAGVRAIWNFADTGLAVPDGVFVRHEHISVGLAELSYFLKSEDVDEST